MLTAISEFLLFIGLFQLGIVGFILVVLSFPAGRTPSILTSSNLRQALLEDYRKRRVKFGGPIGVVVALIISGAACVATGLIARVF